MSNDVAVKLIENSRLGKIERPEFDDVDQRNGFNEIDRGDKEVSGKQRQ